VSRYALVVMWWVSRRSWRRAVWMKNGASSSTASHPYSGSPPNQETPRCDSLGARCSTSRRTPWRTPGSMVPALNLS
jgi:hypothetical protein